MARAAWRSQSALERSDTGTRVSPRAGRTDVTGAKLLYRVFETLPIEADV